LLQGVAAEMMKKAVEYLDSIGCTRVVLHATDQGKNMYKKVGFSVTTDEMDLTISKL
jgi:predicted GNAT family N-acyltransferase